MPGPGVQALLSLAPCKEVDDGHSPVGPQLMLLTCPATDGAGLQDLMHLLCERQVHHLLTLGEVPVMWMSTLQPLQPFHFRRTFNGATVALVQADPKDQGGGLSTSTLRLYEQQPDVFADSQAPSTVHHELACMHVAAEQPGLLDPAALLMLARWLHTAVPAGAPVAVIADGPSLHGLTGQLAMTQALLLRQPAVTAQDKHGKRQRNELLTDIAAQLTGMDQRYVAGKDHLSAVIEAHRAAQMDGSAFTLNRPTKRIDRADATPSVMPSAEPAPMNHRPSSALPQAVIQELRQRHALRPAGSPAETRSSAHAAPELWDTRLEDPSWCDSDFDSPSS